MKPNMVFEPQNLNPFLSGSQFCFGIGLTAHGMNVTSHDITTVHNVILSYSHRLLKTFPGRGKSWASPTARFIKKKPTSVGDTK